VVEKRCLSLMLLICRCGTIYIILNLFGRLVSTDFETESLPKIYKITLSSAHRLCKGLYVEPCRAETQLPRQTRCETNPRGDKETIKEVRNTEKYLPCPSKRIIGMIKSSKFKILI
jgi:hypothetical protein